MTSVAPVYVKHSSLNASRNDSQLAYRLCMATSAVVPGHILGARQVRGLWEIHIKTSVARDKLLLKGFIFRENLILLHASDPFAAQHIPSEKITIRDVPFHCSDAHVMKYLRSQSQLKLRSNIIAGKIRNNNNELTDFLNGDRYVYVEQRFSPVLEQEVMIDGHPCRVWHPNQALKCKGCSQDGHRTTDCDMCPAYIEEPKDAIIFWQSTHIFSNFYMCNFRLFDLDFKSSEHCYQYCKLKYIGQEEHAHDVLHCDTPRQAKNIAAKIPDHMLIQWHEQKLEIMYRILVAKAHGCDKFRQALISSGNKILVEGSMDAFWGIGMPGFHAKNTHPEYLCGNNHLGKILMDIRNSLQNDLVNELTTPQTVVHLQTAIDDKTMDQSDSASGSSPSANSTAIAGAADTLVNDGTVVSRETAEPAPTPEMTDTEASPGSAVSPVSADSPMSTEVAATPGITEAETPPDYAAPSGSAAPLSSSAPLGSAVPPGSAAPPSSSTSPGSAAPPSYSTPPDSDAPPGSAARNMCAEDAVPPMATGTTGAMTAASPASAETTATLVTTGTPATHGTAAPPVDAENTAPPAAAAEAVASPVAIGATPTLETAGTADSTDTPSTELKDQPSDMSIASCSGTSQNYTNQLNGEHSTDVLKSVRSSMSDISEASSCASIAEQISEVEVVQRKTPVTVRRRTVKKTPRQHQPVEGPIDSFFQKLKRKLSADKESDTVADGGQKQHRSDEPYS